MIRSGPLGPSDVDPDDIRDVACDATAPSQVCNPPVREPDSPEPPDLPTWVTRRGSDSWANCSWCC